MLRRVSAVAPVPRQEDIGIDAICTLLRKERRNLHAENTFAVQIKAASVSTIDMNENAMVWLRNLDMPFFLLSVDLKTAGASLYSYERAIIRNFESGGTPRARKLYIHKPIGINSINETQPYILSDDDDNNPRFEQRWLGPAIVSFSLSDLVQTRTIDLLYTLLKSWCLEVARSISLRRHHIDYDLYWKTGHPPKHTSRFTSVRSNEATQSLEAAAPLLWRAELALSAGTGEEIAEFSAMWRLFAKHGVSFTSDRREPNEQKDFNDEGGK